MYAKSLFLLSLVVVNFFLVLSGIGGALGLWGFYLLLGLSFSICTMNIAHDALHGAYLQKSGPNRLLGLLMDLFGTSSFYWRKEHVVDHHTFTNIAEHDADLDVPIVLRLCPRAPHRSFHRFQHIYAPFLYSLNLIHWIYISDFKRLYHVFKNRGKKNTESRNTTPSAVEIGTLIAFKLLHVSLFLLLPIYLLPFSWWQILLGYLSCLSIAGITLTTIFQLAHIIDNVAFPLPNELGKMEYSFVKHQMATTSNFATNNKLVSFLFGGLNFQIEHHLFPHICHRHLPKISPIVRATAQEFGVPYNQNPSFTAAVKSHFKTLKKLGRNP